MESRKRVKGTVNLNRQKQSERLSDGLDRNRHKKQSMSISLSNSVKKISTRTSSETLKSNIFTPKSSSNLLNSYSTKRITNRGSSIGAGLSSRNSSKEKLNEGKEINAKKSLSLFQSELTDYEKGEILDYQDIFYYGKISNKIKPKTSLINNGFDDERGDYFLIAGDHIAYRYEILSLLGKGNFGQVALCHDHKRNEKVALKIVRNKKRFNQQAAVEIKVLQTLRENDPDCSNHVVKIKNYFVFRKHVCITFERLSMNLYELLHQNSFQGFSFSLVHKFTMQIVKCLNYTFQFKIVHCDLKPENIMLVNNHAATINIIDFGSSCFEPEQIYTYIQSRFYRAPEIILGIRYSTAIDMWSLGCIVMEFCTGFPIFIGGDEQEQVQFIIEVLGLPEEEVLKMSTRSKLFFDSKGCAKVDPSKAKEPGSKKIQDILNGAPEPLIDFVSRCLVWNPKNRMTAPEALQHPFILGKKKQKNKVKTSTSIN